jgi:hypothetical protein
MAMAGLPWCCGARGVNESRYVLARAEGSHILD